MSEMTPREIVSELDQHIIGQKEAKRAVAIALRNRWRRMQLHPRAISRAATATTTATSSRSVMPLPTRTS